MGLAEIRPNSHHPTSEYDIASSERVGQFANLVLYGFAVIGDRVVRAPIVTNMLLRHKSLSQPENASREQRLAPPEAQRPGSGARGFLRVACNRRFGLMISLAINGHTAGLCFFSQSCSAASTRVCQPSPVARKL